MKAYANMYYRARMQAAQREPLHASRERTASEIFVSCEALADYETGRTVPPCDVVQKMVEAYNDPDLKAAHIRACCPLLPDYGGEGCSELARAALGWAIAFQSAQDIALQFATVARDGRITQDELPAAQTIRAKAVELRRIMEETIAAINRKLAGVETILLFTEPELTSISSTIVRELLQYGKDVSDFLPEGMEVE